MEDEAILSAAGDKCLVKHAMKLGRSSGRAGNLAILLLVVSQSDGCRVPY